MGNCTSCSSQPLSPVRAPPPQVGDPSLFRLEKSSAAIPYRDLIVLDKIPIACPPWEAVHNGTFYSVPVLIKRLPKSNQELVDLFECAVKIMVNISHPNLVQFLGASTDSTHSLYMVTEKLAKGDLATLLASDETLSSKMCIVIMADIAKGMNYLHSHTPCIPHAHLKAVNVHITKDFHAKVANFELGWKSVEQSLSWVAPEVLRQDDTIHDEASDAYSFSMVAVEIMNRGPPYRHKRLNDTQLKHQIVMQGYRPDIVAPEQWPLELLKLVTACWSEKPTDRPTFGDIIDALEKLLEE